MTSSVSLASLNAQEDKRTTWAYKSLSDVCEINPKRDSIVRADDESTSFVPMAAIDEDSHAIAQVLTRPYGEVRKGYTFFREGDVLFAKITPCMQNGKHAIACNMKGGFGFGTTEFHVLRPGSSVTSEWIHLFLIQPAILAAAESTFTGAVGQQRVPENFLAGLTIPVPPIQDQPRIVRTLLDQIAEIHRARAAAEAQLEAARALVKAQLEAIFNSSQTRLWPKKPIKQVGTVSSGATPTRGRPDFFRGSINWVKTLDLNCGLVTDTVEKITPEALDSVRGEILPEGTVMVAMYGGAGTIGKSGILGISAATNQAVCSIIPDTEQLLSEFLHFYFLHIREEWMQYSSGNRRDPNINKSAVENMQIPVPSISIQRETVLLLRNYESSARHLQTTVKDQLEQVQHLSGKFLRAAFSGELR